jgi:hypothetical protein
MLVTASEIITLIGSVPQSTGPRLELDQSTFHSQFGVFWHLLAPESVWFCIKEVQLGFQHWGSKSTLLI